MNSKPGQEIPVPVLFYTGHRNIYGKGRSTMTNTVKHTGKAWSIPGGMMISALISIITTFIFSVIIATFLYSEKITWEQAGYWIMGVLFTASFLGGKCAYAAIKRQRMIVSLMSGLLYWGILLCITALFFGGQFEAVGETAAIIGAGAGTAALVFGRIPTKQRKKARGAYR